MKKFPPEFADLLTPQGLRLLQKPVTNGGCLFKATACYFVTYPQLIDQRKAESCLQLLDQYIYPHLAREERTIAPESTKNLKHNYEERLNKTIRIKTAFLRRRTARSFRAAEQIGLLQMMQSESFVAFAEAVSGFKLARYWSRQVSCYEEGDYAGPHNDHHPEVETLRNGFIDLHVAFSNNSVAHQFLVYEVNGHFSQIVDINTCGGISVYELPFWHYTTPLTAKAGLEKQARRWLLLGTFQILDLERSSLTKH